MTWLAGSGGENERRPLRGGRRWAAVVGAVLLAALGAGGVVAAPAEAAGPINHIFLSYHGSPTYTWTLRLYDKAGHQKYNASNTCTGGCKQSFSYDPATISSAYIHINTGTADQTWTFTAQTGSGHDNCILIKAGGQIVYTGDETQGCNGR